MSSVIDFDQEVRDETTINNYKDDEEDVILPGFRFHPTDEELIGFYLQRKVDDKPIRMDIIKQVNIYKYEPWDLRKVNNVGEREWYFFCMRGRKYRNSVRPNRVTGSGFWKATGIDKPVYSNSTKQQLPIGLKKSLVYYRGSAGKGTKTDWMMHEFRLPPNTDDTQEAEVWTLCRIFKRISSYKKYTPQTQNHLIKPTTKDQNQSLIIDSNSKTCSSVDEHSDQNTNHHQHYMSFGDSQEQFSYHDHKKTKHDDPETRNGQLFFHANNSLDDHQHRVSSMEANYINNNTSSCFWNSVNGTNQDIYSNGVSYSWDELGSVVELQNGTVDFSFAYNNYYST